MADPKTLDDAPQISSAATAQSSQPKIVNRRNFLRGAFATAAVFTAGKLLDSHNADIEQDARELSQPTHALKISDHNLLSLLQQLKSKDYNLFCLGDNDHNSAAAPKAICTILGDDTVGITDHFIEAPERGKYNADVAAVIDQASYQQADSQHAAAVEAVSQLHIDKSSRGRDINIHRTDSYLSPAEAKAKISSQTSSKNFWERNLATAQFLFMRRSILNAEEERMHFRNCNMANVIAEDFTKKLAKNEKGCALFSIGNQHLKGENGVPVLLNQAKIPGLKIATIETLAVNIKAMDNKVWQCNDRPDHFVVTSYDKENGFAFSPDTRSVEAIGKALYVFPEMRRIASPSSISAR